ncbi:MAG: sensor histidine kinase [Gemmataceae bacterium]
MDAARPRRGRGAGRGRRGRHVQAIEIKAIVCCPLVKGGRLEALMAVHQSARRAWTAAEVALVEEVVERCWAHIERARSEAALREADRRMDEFLALLAHELRNPLAPLRNGLQMMRIAANDPAAVAQVRGMMERQTSHLVRLIDDLLDVSRISRGKNGLQRARVTLQEVIGCAVETALPAIDAGRATPSPCRCRTSRYTLTRT